MHVYGKSLENVLRNNRKSPLGHKWSSPLKGIKKREILRKIKNLLLKQFVSNYLTILTVHIMICTVNNEQIRLVSWVNNFRPLGPLIYYVSPSTKETYCFTMYSSTSSSASYSTSAFTNRALSGA